MGKIFESLSSIPWKILFGISSSFSFFYLTFTILFIIFGFLLLRLESKAYVLQKEIENLENLAKNNLQ
jgi:cell division protein FtsL